MSKFLHIIEELMKAKLTPAEKERKKNQGTIDAALDRVKKGSKDPSDLAISKQSQVNKKKALQAMKQAPSRQRQLPAALMVPFGMQSAVQLP